MTDAHETMKLIGTHEHTTSDGTRIRVSVSTGEGPISEEDKQFILKCFPSDVREVIEKAMDKRSLIQ